MNALTSERIHVWQETETDTCLNLGLVRNDTGNAGELQLELARVNTEAKLGMQYFAGVLAGVLSVKAMGNGPQRLFHCNVQPIEHYVPYALLWGSYPSNVEVKPMIHGGIVSSLVTCIFAAQVGTASSLDSSELDVDVFLAEIEAIAAIPKNKDALRKLYNAFDDRADAKEFDITDAALSRLDPRRLRPEVAVGVLTITLPWRRELPARLMFARAVRKHFEAELGLERANKILRGLE